MYNDIIPPPPNTLTFLIITHRKWIESMVITILKHIQISEK